MGMRHVNGGAFVAHVDDADALARDVVPDRLDMAALQAEDAVDAARLEEARDPGRAGLLVGVEILISIAGVLTRPHSRWSSCLLRSQHAVQDLAGRGARHFVVADERDRARPLVAGDACPCTIRGSRPRVGVSPSCATMTACTRSPHFSSGNADHRHVFHLVDAPPSSASTSDG